MPAKTFIDFLGKIKAQDSPFPINVLYGFNEFLGEKVIDAFCSSFIEEKSDFNYRRFYFDSENAADWETIIDEVNSSSFFVQSRKIVVATIREEKFIALKAAEKEILKKYIEKPNPNSILVIYYSMNLSKDDYKQVKRTKIDKLLKAFNAPHTFTVDLDNIRDHEVKRYIQAYLKECGITITADALEKIHEVMDEDFISVLHQLPKLAIAGVTDRGLDSTDIDKMVSGVEAHSIWDLTDALESENTKKYLKTLDYLFLHGSKPALIIGTLVTHYNKLYIAKFLLKRNWRTGDVGAALGQHRFFLDKFIHSARSISDAQMQKILRLIYQLDFESKTSAEDFARLSLQTFAFRTRLGGAQPPFIS